MFCFFGLFLVASCAPARFVEPLDKGEWSVGANLGGPVLDFGGAPIPVPLSAVEVGYGLDSSLTVHGALHATSMLFGNGQLDLGVTYKFVNQNKWIPNVSVSPGVNVIYSPSAKTGKLWPMLDLNAYWNYGKRTNYIYLGVNNYFELSRTMANNQPQNHNWLFSPQLGHILKGKKDKWEMITEFKYIGPNISSEYSFIPYQGIVNQGAIGFYLGVRRKF
jgi:hypothetical protein